MKIKPDISNYWMLWEIRRCKDAREVSPRLSAMLIEIVDRYFKKSAFTPYPYRDDMAAYAAEELHKRILKFDPQKSENPFSYAVVMAHQVGMIYIKKKQEEFKKALAAIDA